VFVRYKIEQVRVFVGSIRQNNYRCLLDMGTIECFVQI
jgi:hypothetical protein